MNSPLTSRPNLKLFLMMAVLILALKEWVEPADSEELEPRLTARQLSCATLSEAELLQLESKALAAPSARIFFLLSDKHKARGDFAKAMQCLRKAGILAEIEDRRN